MTKVLVLDGVNCCDDCPLKELNEYDGEYYCCINPEYSINVFDLEKFPTNCPLTEMEIPDNE